MSIRRGSFTTAAKGEAIMKDVKLEPTLKRNLLTSERGFIEFLYGVGKRRETTAILESLISSSCEVSRASRLGLAC